MACSMPPMYWSTGAQRSPPSRGRRCACRPSPRDSAGSTRSCRRRCPSCRSRAAPAPPQRGHVAADEAGVPRQRVALAAGELDVVGQLDRQLGLRHRHDAAGVAVDDRDRRAPVALARDQPVAQAVGDLAAALAAPPRATRRSCARCRRPGARPSNSPVPRIRPASGHRLGHRRRVEVGPPRADRRGAPAAPPSARTRGRAGRARARPSPRRCRSRAGRSSRARSGSARRSPG